MKVATISEIRMPDATHAEGQGARLGDHASHDPAGAGDEAARSSRSPQLDGVPAAWLDQLLVASASLPVDAGEQAVIEGCLRAVVGTLGRYAAGARVAGRARGADVFRVFPEGVGPLHAVAPSVGVLLSEAVEGAAGRVFPELPHEHVFEIAEAPGSTLHLAGDVPMEEGPVRHLGRRAAQVLGRGLELSRAWARAEEHERRAHALHAHVIQADKLASFGQIAAGLVHELNNPLTSILAYADFLLRKSHGDQGDAERLRRISESATRMLRFTRDLVSYARPSQERAIAIALGPVIDQAIAFCQHVIDEAGVTVVRSYEREGSVVVAVPEQLAQVFVNLITNACHAMPAEGGRLVLLVTRPEPQRVRVVVEDNGHGIAPEHLPQLFAPFFTTKRQGQGTGLGLSIVQRIVEAHGGRVFAEANEPTGARFVVELPCSAAAAAEEGPSG